MYPEPKSVDPVDICFSCDGTPHIACHECKVLHCALHASILCQSEICVGLRQLWTATLATVALASASAMQCLLNIPKMLMVNSKMTKNLASSYKGN